MMLRGLTSLSRSTSVQTTSGFFVPRPSLTVWTTDDPAWTPRHRTVSIWDRTWPSRASGLATDAPNGDPDDRLTTARPTWHRRRRGDISMVAWVDEVKGQCERRMKMLTTSELRTSWRRRRWSGPTDCYTFWGPQQLPFWGRSVLLRHSRDLFTIAAWWKPALRKLDSVRISCCWLIVCLPFKN